MYQGFIVHLKIARETCKTKGFKKHFGETFYIN